MSYESVVLVKQVPDTSSITGRAIKEDGTVNRAALPAIFNPDDLHALEMALQVKDEHGGSVTVMTMGPPPAAEILRDSLYRGADRVVLLTDRKAAGSDTLATSYLLKCAVEHGGHFDLVFCGRQAIDGDTAQVGPQVAEKLNIPQITYTEAIESLKGDTIVARRALPLGTETVKCRLPCLLTVVGTANEPRPPHVRRLAQFKMAATPLEYKTLLKQWPEFESEEALEAYLLERDLLIPVWNAAEVNADVSRLGLDGSPTKVSKVDFVVLEAHGSTELAAEPKDLEELMGHLVDEYIL